MIAVDGQADVFQMSAERGERRHHFRTVCATRNTRHALHAAECNGLNATAAPGVNIFLSESSSFSRDCVDFLGCTYVRDHRRSYNEQV